MARGLTALRAALGAVGGVTDALQQRELLKEKQKRDQEAAEREELALYLQSGYRIGPMGQALSTVEREQTAPGRAPAPTTLAVPETRSTRPALASEYGVQPTSGQPRSSSLEAPAKAASAPAARPTVQRPFRGQTINLIAPESQEEKDARELVNYEQKLLVEQKATLAKEQAERDAQEKKFAADVERLKKAGLTEQTAVAALMTGGKYNDLFMTPDKQAELALRRQELKLQQDKFELDKTESGVGGTGKAGGREPSAMQQMMIARVNVARRQAQAAHQQMVKFENDIISGSQKPIGSIEAQLANEMFKDTRFNRIAEGRLNKMNPELARYVRNAKAIGAAERLVMPRGGSNLLMNIETALAGIGPGATKELIETTQAFRSGLVEGVQKETGEGLLEAENARLESAIGTDAERRGGSSKPTKSNPYR